MDAVGLKLVVDEVVLGLAALAADVALGPGFGRWPVRVDVFHVLAKIARRGVAATAVAADGPQVLVTEGSVQSREILGHS